MVAAKAKTLLLEFCSLTTAHGFAYLANWRNKAELIFWRILVLASLTWSAVLAFQTFVHWIEEPVVKVIMSVNYDPSKVLAPSIAFCPDQYLDDLHLLSIRLNEIEFRCKDRDDARFAGMKLCNSSYMRAIREKKSSPFHHFLQVLKEMINSAPSTVGGEIDWEKQSDRIIMIEDKELWSLERDPLGFVRNYPERPVMPKDEDLFTFKYFPFVIEEFLKYHPNALLSSTLKLDDVRRIDFGFLSNMSHGEYVAPETIMNTLKVIDQSLLNIGELKGRGYDHVGYPHQKVPLGIEHNRAFWSGLVKRQYFLDKCSAVGLGSLVRQYLPSMVFQDDDTLASKFPLSTEVDSFRRRTILEQLFNFTGSFLSLEPLQWTMHMETRPEPRSYFKDFLTSTLTRSKFTEKAARGILSALQFALLTYPTPETLVRTDLTEKWEFNLYEEDTKTEEAEPEKYTVGHFLDDTDTYNIGTFFQIDELAKRFNQKKKWVQPKPYQVGRRLSGLNMIPYCSESANCREHMKQMTTANGLCSVWNGRANQADMTTNHMTPLLKEVFKLPEKETELRFSDIGSMVFLLDVHNNEIKKSVHDSGCMSIVIGGVQVAPYIIDSHVLRPGLTTLLTVFPFINTADKRTETFSQGNRKCYLPDEKPDKSSFFERYTKHGCIYECAIQAALDMQDRNGTCIPWDIPYPFQLGDTWICHGKASLEFKQQLHNALYECESKCTEACTSTSYTVTKESYLTDPVLACRNQYFFTAIQDEEADREFAAVHSVRTGYLLGTIKEKYCYTKMQNDAIILKIRASQGNIIQVNMQQTVSTLDYIGLFGGMLGLFAGCSVQFLMELVHLAMASLSAGCSMSRVGGASTKSPFLMRMGRLYLESTTLHGFFHISTAWNRISKSVWGIAVLVCIVFGSELSRRAYLGFIEQPIMKILERDKLLITSTPFPTITICPQQYNDRWSLAQGMLNTLQVGDPEFGPIFEHFLELLVSHVWISDHVLSTGPQINSTLTNEVFRLYELNPDNHNLLGAKALEILNGDIKELGIKSQESSTIYEIDLGRETKWHGIVIEGDSLSNKSVQRLGGSSSPQGQVQFCPEHQLEAFGISLSRWHWECHYKKAITSKYIIIHVNEALTSVGPVLYSPVCKGPEPKDKSRFEHYDHCLEGYNLSSTNASLSFVERNPSWANLEYCRNDLTCVKDVKRLLQIHVWEEQAISKLGTIISRFAETVVKGTFHPSEHNIRENSLILSSKKSELQLHELLASLLGTLFNNSSLDLSLLEVPVLLDQLSQFDDLLTQTDREQHSSRIYYAHKKLWEKQVVPANSTYRFRVHVEKIFDIFFKLKRYDFFIHAKRVLNEQGIIIRSCEKWIEFAPDCDQMDKTGSMSYLDLAQDLGLDTIQNASASNYFSNMMASYLKDVMTVMRFSQVQANFYLDPQKIQTALNEKWIIKKQENLKQYKHIQLRSGKVMKAQEYLDKNLPLDKIDPTYWIDYSWNRLEMLPLCAFGNVYPGSFECRSKFHHVITDQGICSAFNSLSLQSQYRESKYINIFKGLYNTAPESTAAPAPGSGTMNSLNLVLDIHQTDVFGSQSGYFKITINNAYDSFSTLEGFSVFVGQRTEITMKTMVLKSDNNVQGDVSMKARNCRFKDELGGANSPFLHYTQKRCQYECQLKTAKENVPCIPWNHYHFDDELSSAICTRSQVTDFQLNVTNAASKCLTSCLESCEDVKYEHVINQFELNPHVTCSDHKILMLAQLGISEKHDFFYWKYWRQSQWLLDSMGNNLPTDELSRCVEKVEQDYAFVNFVLSEPHASVLTMSKKYAYSAQLSIIGGTLALWTGFSLISGIEFCYWLFMVATDKLYQQLSWNTLA